jgi:hypothetical protein
MRPCVSSGVDQPRFQLKTRHITALRERACLEDARQQIRFRVEQFAKLTEIGSIEKSV